MNRYEWQGKSCTVKEIAAETGVGYKLLLQRLGNGYSLDQAVTANPMQDSILHWLGGKSPHDFVDESTEDVYAEYWQWCVKHDFHPVGKSHLMKAIRKAYPDDLKIIPYKGKRTFRGLCPM